MKTICSLFLVAIITLAVQANAAANKLRLELPPAVYAVPGQEMNIYFDNIILAVNYNAYVFDVSCAKGRQDKNRWRFTVKPEDIGKYPWKIEIYNASNELVAEGQTEIIVSPADAGSGKTISLLLVGDSLTNSSIYPNELYELFHKPGNPKVTFIGSHSGNGKAPGNFAHEGYGGWKWETFLTNYTSIQNNYRAKSKFLVEKNGAPALDFKAYCDQYAGGKTPDFITVMLGTNDVFNAKEDNLEATIDQILKNADKLLAEFQKVAPDAQIGLALTIPPAATQDAFGSNYQCGQTRWQYRRNQYRLVERMIEKYGNGQCRNISLIPAYLNLDCENNFPVIVEPVNSRNKTAVSRQNNGVHPAAEGYLQIADSFYAWFKFKLSDKK
ncbi:MAG: SGNH/GDSL hydrolase family protein [Victivallaceae bacterium]